MRREALLLSVLLAAACSSGDGGSASPDVDPAFAGTWTGQASVTFFKPSGVVRVFFWPTLRISISGRTAEISGRLCLDGTQAVVAQATANPDTVEWNGEPGSNIECATFYTGLPECFFSYRYQHLVARMVGGALTLQATGSSAGCNSTTGSAMLVYPDDGSAPPPPHP